jgi:hypothetical protein
MERYILVSAILGFIVLIIFLTNIELTNLLTKKLL